MCIEMGVKNIILTVDVPAECLKKYGNAIDKFFACAVALLTGCLFGHTVCVIGLPVEKATRVIFAVYCVVWLLWWIAGKIVGYIFTWCRKRNRA